MSERIDISVILNIHREAPFLKATLLSLSHCLEEAAAAGLACELIAVFDRSDELTRHVFDQGIPAKIASLQILTIDAGSLALARNAGIERATGTYVWTADADDLTSRNALVDLHGMAENLRGKKAGFYLEYMILFGARYHLNKYASSSLLTVTDFCFEHPYVSRIFLPRSAFATHPYRHMDTACGYAYEDWDLACRLKRDNFDFHVVPETILFYRQRRGSIMDFTPKTSILPPSDFFDPGWYPEQLASDLGPGQNYPDFISRRLLNSGNDISRELRDSTRLHNYLLETCSMDPEVEYEKVMDSASWFALQHPGHHLGYKLAELFRLVGRKGFTDVILASSAHPEDPELLSTILFRSLLCRDPSSRALIIAIEPSRTDRWQQLPPHHAVVIDLCHLFPGTDPYDRDRLAVRLAISTASVGSRLHLLPSEACHRLMADYGRQLLCHFRSLYYRCQDSQRRVQGWDLMGPSALHFLRDHLSRLTQVIYTSSELLERDRMRLGLASELCSLLAAPRRDPDSERGTSAGAPGLRLLWIGPQETPGIRWTLSQLRSLVAGDPGTPPLVIEAHEPGDGGAENLDLGGFDAVICSPGLAGRPFLLERAIAAGLAVIAPGTGSPAEPDPPWLHDPQHQPGSAAGLGAYVDAIRPVVGSDGEGRPLRAVGTTVMAGANARLGQIVPKGVDSLLDRLECTKR